ncbi:MAG: hypothetical protein LQ346_003804 [Caloplaca aetnensis]|nr:MAG: hypothetical protein LQ346_003804 [Caloplaca aetnensis]
MRPSGLSMCRDHLLHNNSAALLSSSLRSSPRGHHPAPPHHQHFHTTRCIRSALFNLAGLSTSREGQYLSKERGIPRTEFSPHLELIRSSEVDTQQAPGSRRASPAQPRATDDIKVPPLQGSVVVARAEYAALKERVGKLQRKLESSIRAKRRLANLYDARRKSSFDYSEMAIFIVLLAMTDAFVEVHVIPKFKAWRASPMEKGSAHEGEAAVITEDISEAIPESGQNTEDSRQPRAWSTLFWAPTADDH